MADVSLPTAVLDETMLPRTSIDQPFRFLDLPAEIRYTILSFTDLVTPRREVTWNPEQGYHLLQTETQKRSFCTHDHNPPSKSHPRPSHPLPACSRCRCTYHQLSPASHNSHPDNLLLKCNCWHPPLPHLLVSKPYSHLALETLFTQNRFVIHPSTDLYTTAAPCRPFLGTELSSFLRNMPTHPLHWLKDLEIIFPAYEAQKHTRVSKLAIWDLTSVLKDRGQLLNLPAMKIKLWIPFVDPDVCIDKVILHTRGLPKKECLKLWRRYREMVLAFTELQVQALVSFPPRGVRYEAGRGAGGRGG
ncbi:hypothetical protein BDZ85DRAFT_260779 [Elsinoe ampelina]|uniref:Uncharacterized protein n=1 Tax=Elsinoe ampelina TaxID=302913 RepID=A0A6A6GF36_9PEZI|nr:hypothetical protein BDZ85DRAFT_260779 [Elsinoe ampelina]